MGCNLVLPHADSLSVPFDLGLGRVHETGHAQNAALLTFCRTHGATLLFLHGKTRMINGFFSYTGIGTLTSFGYTEHVNELDKGRKIESRAFNSNYCSHFAGLMAHLA